MSSSPTPSEREKKDKEDRAREAEEQAKLPYKWTQTIQDLDITVTVPSNLKGRDLIVEFTKTKLKVAIKGQEPIIDVSPPASFSHSPSFTLCYLLHLCTHTRPESPNPTSQPQFLPFHKPNLPI